MVDAVAAGSRVAQHAGAEGGHADVVVAGAQVAAAHAGVQRRELADEAADEVRQLGSRRHPIDQRQVLLQRAVPVDAVHAGVVEVVAFHAPGVDDDLPPVFAHVQGEGPAAQVDLSVAEAVADRLGAGVDDVEVVAAAHQELLAVGRQLRRANALDHGDGFGVVAVEGQGHQVGTSAEAAAGFA